MEAEDHSRMPSGSVEHQDIKPVVSDSEVNLKDELPMEGIHKESNSDDEKTELQVAKFLEVNLKEEPTEPMSPECDGDDDDDVNDETEQEVANFLEVNIKEEPIEEQEGLTQWMNLVERNKSLEKGNKQRRKSKILSSVDDYQTDELNVKRGKKTKSAIKNKGTNEDFNGKIDKLSSRSEYYKQYRLKKKQEIAQAENDPTSDVNKIILEKAARNKNSSKKRLLKFRIRQQEETSQAKNDPICEQNKIILEKASQNKYFNKKRVLQFRRRQKEAISQAQKDPRSEMSKIILDKAAHNKSLTTKRLSKFFSRKKEEIIKAKDDPLGEQYKIIMDKIEHQRMLGKKRALEYRKRQKLKKILTDTGYLQTSQIPGSSQSNVTMMTTTHGSEVPGPSS